jgi:MFS family permease
MSSSLAPEQREWLDGLQRRALVVGAAALIVCVIGCVIGVFTGSTLATQFFRAYLAAYMYCLGVALGSLVILMIYHLTGGAWGYIVRRILEATTRTIPLLAILFVPVACGVYYLYLWTDPAQVAGNPSLQYKQIYLNLPFFFVRAVLYFVLWSLLAYFLNHWSRAQDRSESPVLAERMQRLSGPGLVVYGISLTFAAVDWVMSLQPAFHSTIFGPLVATSEMLSALSFTILVMIWLAVAACRGRLAGRLPRPRQPAADVSHPLGVHGLLPIHANLDRQFAL